MNEVSSEKESNSKPNPIGTRIKRLREQSGLTQEELGSRIAKTKTAISNIESGRNGARMSTLTDIANALHITVQEILYPTSNRQSSYQDTFGQHNNVQAVGFLADMVGVDLPFVSFRARASFIELGMGIQHPNNFETLRLYVASEEEAARYTGALVFEVEGDSMEPLLRSGEKVIAWQVPEGKWEQVYNQVCVVAYDDTVTIKAVRENELFTRNLLTLYAQNPAAGFLPVQRQQIQSLWRVEEFFDRPKIRL
jgi:transcriptional regulator with XRE-family HTH domain